MAASPARWAQHVARIGADASAALGAEQDDSGARSHDHVLDAADEVAFEATDRFLAGLPVAALLGEVGRGAGR